MLKPALFGLGCLMQVLLLFVMMLYAAVMVTVGVYCLHPNLVIAVCAAAVVALGVFTSLARN